MMLDYEERKQMYNLAVVIHSVCVHTIVRMPISTLEEIDTKSALVRVAVRTNDAIARNRMDSIWRI